MSLPVYQQIMIKSSSPEEVTALLDPEINLRHPVVLNIKSMNMEEQKEIVKLIEVFFSTKNLSFKFPYPVYILSDHDPLVSKIMILKNEKELPPFFRKRDGKVNIKEAHLCEKNNLLQQDVKNNDAASGQSEIETYSDFHRIIFNQESERKFYQQILSGLLKAK